MNTQHGNTYSANGTFQRLSGCNDVLSNHNVSCITACCYCRHSSNHIVLTDAQRELEEELASSSAMQPAPAAAYNVPSGNTTSTSETAAMYAAAFGGAFATPAERAAALNSLLQRQLGSQLFDYIYGHLRSRIDAAGSMPYSDAAFKAELQQRVGVNQMQQYVQLVDTLVLLEEMAGQQKAGAM